MGQIVFYTKKLEFAYKRLQTANFNTTYSTTTIYAVKEQELIQKSSN